MSIIGLVSGLLKLVNVLMGWADRKRLVNQGEKNAINANVKATLEILQRAKKRRKDISNMSDGDLDSEL